MRTEEQDQAERDWGRRGHFGESMTCDHFMQDREGEQTDTAGTALEVVPLA